MIVDDNESISYEQLFLEVEMLARHLKRSWSLKGGEHVAIICKNNVSSIKAIFACTRLGLHVYLLNPKIGKLQWQSLLNEFRYDFILYDSNFPHPIPTSALMLDHLVVNSDENIEIPRTSTGNIHLFTAGTTGKAKVLTHTPSLFTYLPVLFTVIWRLKLCRYRTAYVATPICHSYGFAMLLVFLVLGKNIVLSETFRSELIERHRVEVITVVPFLIEKLLETVPHQLASLRCIASGSAELRPATVEKVFRKFGPILFNLYGTSEAGLTTIATPDDLTYSPSTIGKKVSGIRIQIRNVQPGEIGKLYVYRGKQWIDTGDLSYQDDRGYYFLYGRIDDMVNVRGINVYPVELEDVLTKHPNVKQAAVIGSKEKLIAYVQLEPGAHIRKDDLSGWLKERVATYQLPSSIQFVDQLPYTNVGKLDKKKLYRETKEGSTWKEKRH